jgi:hypothetical protein
MTSIRERWWSKQSTRWSQKRNSCYFKTIDDQIRQIGVRIINHCNMCYSLYSHVSFIDEIIRSKNLSPEVKLQIFIVASWSCVLDGYMTPRNPGQYSLTFKIIFKSNFRNRPPLQNGTSKGKFASAAVLQCAVYFFLKCKVNLEWNFCWMHLLFFKDIGAYYCHYNIYIFPLVLGRE